MNRSRHLAVLRRVVTSPGSPLDVDALLDRTMRSLTTLTGDELASLHLLSADGRTLRLRGDRGLSARPTGPPATGHRPLSISSPSSRAVR